MLYIMLKRLGLRSTLTIVNKTQNISTKLIIKTELPTFKQLQNIDSSVNSQYVIIFDRILLKNSTFSKWIKQFELSIAVKAGESLKTMDQFSAILNKIQKWESSHKLNRKPTFVAVGGGSVGDFVGFLASVYKRGSKLIHIPSTWLAALDSAHGGKNGLNLNTIKNQIGTIYPAAAVWLSSQVLTSQPSERLHDVYGEVIKTVLLTKPQMLISLEINEKYILKHLNFLIDCKIKIVNQDLYETKGIRHVLNLGHTVGHVLESQLKLSHGYSVALGLIFTARWSYHLGYITDQYFFEVIRKILEVPGMDDLLKKMYSVKNQELAKMLLADKKKSNKSANIRFVFLSSKHKTIIQEKSIKEIVSEYSRQRFSML